MPEMPEVDDLKRMMSSYLDPASLMALGMTNKAHRSVYQRFLDQRGAELLMRTFFDVILDAAEDGEIDPIEKFESLLTSSPHLLTVKIPVVDASRRSLDYPIKFHYPISVWQYAVWAGCVTEALFFRIIPNGETGYRILKDLQTQWNDVRRQGLTFSHGHQVSRDSYGSLETERATAIETILSNWIAMLEMIDQCPSIESISYTEQWRFLTAWVIHGRENFTQMAQPIPCLQKELFNWFVKIANTCPTYDALIPLIQALAFPKDFVIDCLQLDLDEESGTSTVILEQMLGALMFDPVTMGELMIYVLNHYLFDSPNRTDQSIYSRLSTLYTNLFSDARVHNDTLVRFLSHYEINLPLMSALPFTAPLYDSITHGLARRIQDEPDYWSPVFIQLKNSEGTTKLDTRLSSGVMLCLAKNGRIDIAIKLLCDMMNQMSPGVRNKNKTAYYLCMKKIFEAYYQQAQLAFSLENMVLIFDEICTQCVLYLTPHNNSQEPLLRQDLLRTLDYVSPEDRARVAVQSLQRISDAPGMVDARLYDNLRLLYSPRDVPLDVKKMCFELIFSRGSYPTKFHCIVAHRENLAPITDENILNLCIEYLGSAQTPTIRWSLVPRGYRDEALGEVLLTVPALSGKILTYIESLPVADQQRFRQNKPYKIHACQIAIADRLQTLKNEVSRLGGNERPLFEAACENFSQAMEQYKTDRNAPALEAQFITIFAAPELAPILQTHSHVSDALLDIAINLVLIMTLTLFVYRASQGFQQGFFVHRETLREQFVNALSVPTQELSLL